jgi:hypothetical protein
MDALATSQISMGAAHFRPKPDCEANAVSGANDFKSFQDVKKIAMLDMVLGIGPESPWQ